jgi:CheY-like chemotaxis protein
MRNLKPILLVEDDTVDATMVKRAMKDLNVINPLVHLVNGEEALKYLRDNTNDKPCVILLDLNMPKMSGIEFLQALRADTQLKGIPVVVLTTSKADQDKNECFDHGVAGYIVKPNNYEDFVWAMKVFNLYWTINELPGSVAEAADTNLENVIRD